ncbi:MULTISPECIES: hypothetical protein [Pseudomonas]|uniref:Uncharacterized protein n=1 Tax=Phytopseudomonas flavescens TaxID=29435 RepID=A0A7Y9XKI1_9GAMM|nr:MULTISPECIES: hypothetical protein [Pseudomonas]MCW2292360.1 hypothetical protein [Pseudomonas sp. BIGb0408]NYH73068.1 hypothetical protein [Pseudomonas flavescens]
MHYEVLPLFERGKRKPKKAYSSEPRLRADVRIEEALETPFGRRSSIAITVPSAQGGNPLPQLYEARIGGMAILALTIEGVEFVDGVMYQQEWHCREPEHKIQVPWTLCPRGPLDELL